MSNCFHVRVNLAKEDFSSVQKNFDECHLKFLIKMSTPFTGCY